MLWGTEMVAVGMNTTTDWQVKQAREAPQATQTHSTSDRKYSRGAIEGSGRHAYTLLVARSNLQGKSILRLWSRMRDFDALNDPLPDALVPW